MTTEEKRKKYGIEVPEGTSTEVINLLIKQAEAASKLQETNKKQADQLSEAAKLAKKQEEELLSKEKELADKSDGFGTFKIDDVEYVICFHQTRLQRQNKVVTSNDLLASKSMQREFVEAGYGMVAEKEAWVAERKRQDNLSKQNRQIETPETVKIKG